MAACVAVPVLAACGGTDGGEARTKPSGDTGKATPAAEETAPVTRFSVKREIGAAIDAGGFGRPPVVDVPDSKGRDSCTVTAQARTPELPDEKSVRAVTAALERSGWGRMSDWHQNYESLSLWSLKREGWTLDVMTGSLTADQMEAAATPGASAEEKRAFTGMTVTAIDRKCARAVFDAAKASPK